MTKLYKISKHEKDEMYRIWMERMDRRTIIANS